jgi:hypothetical protein
MNFVSQIEENVLIWDGVTAAPHRFGGREFLLNGKEFGHIHHNGMLDILFSKKIREALVAENLANMHHLLPETGWISYYSQNQPENLINALKLLRLNYILHYSKNSKTDIDVQELLQYPKSVQQIVKPI